MSEFLDELARTVARPMPRRRALGLFGGALLGIAGARIPSAKARPATGLDTCVSEGGRLCKCPSINGLFYKICCNPKDDYECVCKAPPNGYAACRPCPSAGRHPGKACGPHGKCCAPGHYCSWPQKGEGFPSNGICCPLGRLGCGVDGPYGAANFTFCCRPGYGCRGKKGTGHCEAS